MAPSLIGWHSSPAAAARERQTFRDFEVLVVDSGPEPTSERLAAAVLDDLKMDTKYEGWVPE